MPLPKLAMIKPSMAWLLVFVPAVSYFMATRLQSSGFRWGQFHHQHPHPHQEPVANWHMSFIWQRTIVIYPCKNCHCKTPWTSCIKDVVCKILWRRHGGTMTNWDAGISCFPNRTQMVGFGDGKWEEVPLPLDDPCIWNHRDVDPITITPVWATIFTRDDLLLRRRKQQNPHNNA